MSKCFLFFFVSVLLSGCCGLNEHMLKDWKEENTPAYNSLCKDQELQLKLTYEINKYAFKLEEGGYTLENSYIVDKDDGIPLVWVYFSSQRLVDIHGSRTVVVDIVNGLLKQLNDADLGYQFKYSDLYVGVDFESFFGRYVDPLYVGRAELKHGYSHFAYAHTAFDPRSVIHHGHQEPYEVSLQIVRAERAVKTPKEKKERVVYDVIKQRERGNLPQEKSTYTNYPKKQLKLPKKP